MFVVYGARPGGALLGKPGACIGAFAVSGVLHDVGLWGARAWDGVSDHDRVFHAHGRGWRVGIGVRATDGKARGRVLRVGVDNGVDYRLGYADD